MAVVFHPPLDFTSSFARLSSVSRGWRNKLWDFYLDKNDRRTNGHEAVKTDQDVVFFPRAALEIELFDPFDGELFVFEGDLVRIRCKILRVLNYVVRECGRKQNDLRVWWKQSVDIVRYCACPSKFAHLPLDTHALITKALLIEHVVCLVKN